MATTQPLEVPEELMEEELQEYGLDFLGTEEEIQPDEGPVFIARAQNRDDGISLHARSFRSEERANGILLGFLRRIADMKTEG